MSNRVQRLFSVLAFVGLACFSILFFVACGGGGGGPDFGAAETHAVSQEIASANTQVQMQAAIDHLIRRTGFNDSGSSDLPPGPIVTTQLRDAYARAQLHFTEAMYSTLAQAYAGIVDETNQRGFPIGITVDQAIASINAKLPAAYANRGLPANAILVLMTSRPGNIPDTAPTITADTRLSPVQVMLLVQFVSNEVRNRSWCTAWCYAALIAKIGLVGAMGFACVSQPELWLMCGEVGIVAIDIAIHDYQNCMSACHNQ